MNDLWIRILWNLRGEDICLEQEGARTLSFGSQIATESAPSSSCLFVFGLPLPVICIYYHIPAWPDHSLSEPHSLCSCVHLSSQMAVAVPHCTAADGDAAWAGNCHELSSVASSLRCYLGLSSLH